jgi:hypothetical protein
MLGKTNRLHFMTIFSLMLAFAVAGCTHPNLYSTVPAPYAAVPIAPGHGRLVFGKGLALIPSQGVFSSGVSYLAEGSSIRLFEIVGTNVIPVAEFTLVPNKDSLISDEMYYVDLPAGVHRFMASRYQHTAENDSLYGRGNIFEIDVKARETIPIFIIPDTGVKTTRIVIEQPQPVVVVPPIMDITRIAKGQKTILPQQQGGGVQVVSFYPFQLTAYPLHQDDIKYACALREKSISDLERATSAQQKAAAQFANDERASFPLTMALTAVSVMKPANSSDAFKNWTTAHQEDLQKRLQLAGPAHTNKKSFDVYGNPAPLPPSATMKGGNTEKTGDTP